MEVIIERKDPVSSTSDTLKIGEEFTGGNSFHQEDPLHE